MFEHLKRNKGFEQLVVMDRTNYQSLAKNTKKLKINLLNMFELSHWCNTIRFTATEFLHISPIFLDTKDIDNWIR